METRKVLIIEDEKPISDIVRFNLSKEGFETETAYDGAEGFEIALRTDPDLILLDVMLPTMDGFEICKKLREKSNVPIIMLTAKEEEVDKVLGLELGADDYITKPFGIRELKARIKAVLRRYKTDGDAESARGDAAVYNFDDLVIDISRHEVWANGEAILLTLKEFELLHKLAENKGRVLTREQLLDTIWGYEYMGETRTVDVHIRSLRKKLGDAGNHIFTVRGLGYKLL